MFYLNFLLRLLAITQIPLKSVGLGDFYFAQGQQQVSLNVSLHALKLEPNNEHGVLSLADL